jgi:hypothetical protein
VQSLRRALRVGGRIVFHEYADYGAWRTAPRRPAVEAFTAEVMAHWRESGGEPDVALALAGLLPAGGFRVTRAEPIVWAIRPSDDAWRWPASFVTIHLRRLLELGRVDAAWCDRVRAEWQAARPTRLPSN